MSTRIVLAPLMTQSQIAYTSELLVKNKMRLRFNAVTGDCFFVSITCTEVSENLNPACSKFQKECKVHL
jgi:hypothetical protein